MTMVALRAPDQVMRLERMGSFFQTRLSFMRSLIRRMHREGWRIAPARFDLDDIGHGIAVYEADTGQRAYSLVCFSQTVEPDQRTDRVIAKVWDATFALYDGRPTDGDVRRLAENVPKQEAGRCSANEIVLARANKSLRLFDHVSGRLADGEQPDIDVIGEVGYLMWTTAVYGNGKFGLADRDKIASRPELAGPFTAELLAVYLIRCFTIDLVEHVARRRSPNTAVALDPGIKRFLGIGNATGLGMAPFLTSHPILIHNWMSARERALARVRSVERAEPAVGKRFDRLIARAERHISEWNVADERQTGHIAQLRKDISRLRDRTGALAIDRPWDALYGWAEAELSLEGQELVVSLIIELYPELVDDLSQEMAADEAAPIDARVSIAELRNLIARDYVWALGIDFSDPARQQRFWYISEEKLEPRLGERHEEPGSSKEMPLAIARDIQVLDAALAEWPGDTNTAAFLIAHPELRHIVRRVQITAEHPYQPVDEVFPGRSRHGLILWCPGLKGGSLMAMGQQKDRQGDLMVSWSEMPRSPGHVFYDRLQLVLIEGGFDGFAEAVCQPYYAARMGAPSVPPGRYFRMHLVGYFEGIDSERGLEWRCSDSLSLREFLLLEMRERVPDHSWLSRTRARLPHEVHTAVFDWVLALIAEAGLVKGERIGVDASTMEANAALRNIVRRDTGEGYRGMLERLAQESGIETPTAEDLARLDRKRKGKKLSNQDWVSRSDPEAKIAKMKDGTTHLAYKPEHAVDLDTGAVVAAELHPADEGDTTTLPKTLAAAEANLEAVDVAPTAEDPAECVTDKGYHSRLVLKALDDGPWKSRISEPKQKGFARWHGDDAARRAVTNNRTRLLSGVAREAFKLRAEIVERSFAHNLDRGGMRRTWLRGRENVHKRYLLHVAGHNLSLLMRQLIGAGTPKEAVAGGIGALFVLVTPAGAVLVVQIVLIVSEDGETAFAAICFAVA